MIIVPVDDRFYYKWDEVETTVTSKFGDKIVIPESRDIRTRIATVLLVGPNCKFLQPGDKIVISSFTGSHLFLVTETSLDDGEKSRISRESEVMALLAKDASQALEMGSRIGEAAKKQGYDVEKKNID